MKTSAVVDEHFSKIFALLKGVSHIDFGLYKPGTIRRRIGRRMFLHKVDSLEDYLHERTRCCWLSSGIEARRHR